VIGDILVIVFGGGSIPGFSDDRRACICLGLGVGATPILLPVGLLPSPPGWRLCGCLALALLLLRLRLWHVCDDWGGGELINGEIRKDPLSRPAR
jgi:hypothetical protein